MRINERTSDRFRNECKRKSGTCKFPTARARHVPQAKTPQTPFLQFFCLQLFILNNNDINNYNCTFIDRISIGSDTGCNCFLAFFLTNVPWKLRIYSNLRCNFLSLLRVLSHTLQARPSLSFFQKLLTRINNSLALLAQHLYFCSLLPQ